MCWLVKGEGIVGMWCVWVDLPELVACVSLPCQLSKRVTSLQQDLTPLNRRNSKEKDRAARVGHAWTCM